jgi:hypothetical protein
MKDDRFDKLLAFLDRLDEAKISYRLNKHLYDAISVEVYAPGEHWEVDFFADGEVYVERFRSNGHIDDEAALEELFRLCSDEETPPKKEANQNDNVARK